VSVLLAIYDPATGDIHRRVTCSESLVDRQCRDGEAALEVARGSIFTDLTHRVDTATGEIVPKP